MQFTSAWIFLCILIQRNVPFYCRKWSFKFCSIHKKVHAFRDIYTGYIHVCVSVCAFIYLLAIIIPKKIPTKFCGHPYSLFMGSKHSPSLFFITYDSLLSYLPVTCHGMEKSNKCCVMFLFVPYKKKKKKSPQKFTSPTHPPPNNSSTNQQYTSSQWKWNTSMYTCLCHIYITQAFSCYSCCITSHHPRERERESLGFISPAQQNFSWIDFLHLHYWAKQPTLLWSCCQTRAGQARQACLGC